LGSEPQPFGDRANEDDAERACEPYQQELRAHDAGRSEALSGSCTKEFFAYADLSSRHTHFHVAYTKGTGMIEFTANQREGTGWPRYYA
jgi:hypothetical protein